ncbi:MAG: TetR/AcrR family transcriptional regulator [Lachnospiraceae bacterium]
MKSDARVRYTKMRIKNAFFQLLKEKDFQHITVTEICTLAEINRTTFYKHYLDTKDLLEKLEEAILESTKTQWKKLYPQNTPEGMESILTGLLTSDDDSVSSLFQADPNFSFRITEIICQDSCKSFMENTENAYSKDQIEMLNRFIVYGCGSVTRKWLLTEKEHRMSPHELAEFLFYLTEKLTH